jgi:hypothetical protein
MMASGNPAGSRHGAEGGEPGDAQGAAAAHLRADCSRCSGLCCVAPPFEEQQGFAFSKPAHVPCRHLQTSFRCGIHGELTARGFPGCSAFECFGAGQRVMRLFRGESWRDSPQSAARLFQAYSRYRVLHELLAMLALALERALPTDRGELASRLQSLDALCESGEALTMPIAPERLRTEVLAQVREALGRAAAGSTAGAHDGGG